MYEFSITVVKSLASIDVTSLFRRLRPPSPHLRLRRASSRRFDILQVGELKAKLQAMEFEMQQGDRAQSLELKVCALTAASPT